MGNGAPSGRPIPQGGLSLLGVFIPRQMGFQVFLRLGDLGSICGAGKRLVLRGVRWGMGFYCATAAKAGVLSRFEFIRYCLQGKAAAIRAARGTGLLLVTIGLIAMQIYA